MDDDAAEVLTNPQLKILYEFKMGRKPKAGDDSNKESMVVAWNFNKMNEPLNFIQWTEREKENLDRLKTEEITIAHTELGKQQRKLAKESLAALSSMSEETMNTYLPSGALDELQSKLTARGL